MARIESPDDPQTGTAGTQSSEKVVRHLEGLEWPATKEEVLTVAHGNAAPGEVIRALQRLPGTRFESPEDVRIAYESMD